MKKDNANISKQDNKEPNNPEVDSQEIEDNQDLIDENDEAKIKEEERFEAARRRGILHIVAGGYLVYLAYSGLTEMLGEVDSSGPWYFYLIYGVFAIIGIFLVVNSIYSQMKNRKK